MSQHIQVALPLPLDRTFTYRIPPELRQRARAGCRAVVPFGQRILTGIIVDDVAAEVPEKKIRQVLDLPDPDPLLPADILEITHWVARYYFCSWGEALKASLPAGQLQKGIRIASPGEAKADNYPGLSPLKRKILESVQDHGALSLSSLARRYRTPSILKHVQHLQALGLLELREIFPGAGVKARWQEFVAPAAALSCASLRQKAAELERRAPAQARILRVISAHNGHLPAVQLLRRAGSSPSALKALLNAGLLRSEKLQIKRYPTLEALTARDEAPLPQPNPDQQEAINAITASLHAGRRDTFLLFGVTGSGKTLVYQKVIEQVLKMGGTALVLIPEISLTPQLVGRFRSCFGDRIGLQHSAMSAGERVDVWRGIRNGEFPIVIGARSAVFAPLPNLKLVIVDEEGDPSFKQHDPSPRYNARDVALVRAQKAGAVAVLGSATPSVESFLNADCGMFKLLELPRRVDRMPPPAIRFTKPPRRRGKVLGEELEQAVVARIQRGEQVILLRNRRGYFTFIFCPKCGNIHRCQHCDIALTFHRQRKSLVRCHICGYYESPPPRTCPQCGGTLRYSGFGTQRIEEELSQLIPAEKIIRMDLDTTGRKGSHHQILKRFAQEEYALLLGTKMVARGHDYPRVTLVGVISADMELAFPDFRCDERAFVLLLQAAGRAGRSTDSGAVGEVLIQTWMPQHPLLKLVKEGDYREFYRREAALRRALNYPPWGWMILFEFSSKNQERARQAAAAFRRLVGSYSLPAECLGPAPAFHARLKEKYRFQMIIKAAKKERLINSNLRRKLSEIMARFMEEKPRGVKFNVDVDPIQIM